MFKYIIKRFLSMMIILWFIITISFFSLHWIDQKTYSEFDKLLPAQKEQIDHQYGFDRPISVQYFDYIFNIIGLEGLITIDQESKDDNLFGFDFGYSFVFDQEVSGVMKSRYPVTLILGYISLLIGTILGIILGFIFALNKSKVVKIIISIFILLGISIPMFIVAIFLQTTFAINHNIFPAMYNNQQVSSLILPIISLVILISAQITKIVSSKMNDIIDQEYIVFVKSINISKLQLICKYYLKNIVLDLLTILGPLFIMVTAGSLGVELIFNIPGMSKVLSASLLGQDTYMTLAIIIFMSLQILIIYFFIDILYAKLDPRISLIGSKDA